MQNDHISRIKFSTVENNLTTEYKSTDKKQKKLDENIMRYIILGMKPLSTVEDENFTKIFKGNLKLKI